MGQQSAIGVLLKWGEKLLSQWGQRRGSWCVPSNWRAYEIWPTFFEYYKLYSMPQVDWFALVTLWRSLSNGSQEMAILNHVAEHWFHREEEVGRLCSGETYSRTSSCAHCPRLAGLCVNTIPPVPAWIQNQPWNVTERYRAWDHAILNELLFWE